MVVNNFDLIEKYLNFNDEDKFYFIQILQRKKENPEMDSSKSKVIKSYYVDNLEYLHKKKDEIIKLCELFNARATIRLNRRSYKKSAFKLLSKIADKINSEHYVMNNIYESVLGSYHSEEHKCWLIDLDGDDVVLKEEIINFINSIEPFENKNKFIVEVPSKNGSHLITEPFNLQVFKEYYLNIKVHKDNFTNLYIYII